MTDDFYATLEPVEGFESLTLRRSYTQLPDDWWLVAADIVNSTAAIERGRYKNVNTVGVSVIAATRNVVRPVEVPYVFGGDGALVCVPGRFVPDVRTALSATIAMAYSAFELELRACVVPVSLVREAGRDVLVARHRVSEHYVQCALFGGGAALAEQRLKDGSLPVDFIVVADEESAADYSGLECRWSEVPSPQEETVALIVDAVGDATDPLPVYARVVARIESIYGDAESCRPVVERGLRVTLARAVLANELALRGWGRALAGRLAEGMKIRIAVIVGWFLLRFGIRWGGVDWGTYRSDLVLNTDFRKFDGSLRLVLTGTEAQRRALSDALESMRAEGELAFGMHVARSAVMTCLIEQRQGGHFHFVDASEGGYAAAALQLKRSTDAPG